MNCCRGIFLDPKNIFTIYVKLYQLVLVLLSWQTVNQEKWRTRDGLLWLIVSIHTPSENLLLLVNYVVKVYAPIWFLIKQKTSFKDGSKHIYQLIMYSRFLPENLRSVVDSVIERNAFLRTQRTYLSVCCLMIETTFGSWHCEE